MTTTRNNGYYWVHYTNLVFQNPETGVGLGYWNGSSWNLWNSDRSEGLGGVADSQLDHVFPQLQVPDSKQTFKSDPHDKNACYRWLLPVDSTTWLIGWGMNGWWDYLGPVNDGEIRAADLSAWGPVVTPPSD